MCRSERNCIIERISGGKGSGDEWCDESGKEEKKEIERRRRKDE